MILGNCKDDTRENKKHFGESPLSFSKDSFSLDLVGYDDQYLLSQSPDKLKEYIILLRDARKRYKKGSAQYNQITESIIVAVKILEG